MGAEQQRRCRDLVALLLERPGGVDHQPGLQYGERGNQILVAIQSRAADRHARLGLQLLRQRLRLAGAARREHELETVHAREMARQPPAEDAGRADQDDTLHGASGKVKRRRVAGSGISQEDFWPKSR